VTRSATPVHMHRDPGALGAPPPHPWRDRRRILQGLSLFLAVTVAGFLVLFAHGRLSHDLHAWRRLAPATLVLGLAQAGLDLLLGGLRLWTFVRALGGRIALWTCVRANTANIFLGGVTPSQSGGGPAQIYILMRGGLSLAMATVASLCGFVGTIVVLLLAGLAVTLLQPTPLGTAGQFRWFSAGTVLLFGGILLLCVLALPGGRFAGGGLRSGLGRLPLVGRRLGRNRNLERLEILLEDYSHFMRHAGRRGKLLMLSGLVLSGLVYLNKFLVAWVVVRGLHLPGRLRDVLYLQAKQSLVMYFAPTPGASGVAEVTAAVLMGGVVPAADMQAYLVLWRAFSLYTGMAIGGLILVRSFVGSARGDGR